MYWKQHALRIGAGIGRLQLIVVVEIVEGRMVACHAEATNAAVAFAELPAGQAALTVATGKVVAAPDGAVPSEVNLLSNRDGFTIEIDESVCVF